MNHSQDDKEQAQFDAENPPRWNQRRTNHLPPHETIQVMFGGLMGFCYNSDGNGEIGIVRGAAKHKLKIDVSERVDSGGRIDSKTKLKNIPGDPVVDPSDDEFTLNVTKVGDEGVRFFMVDGELDRFADVKLKPPPPYINDFRWMLDMEGSAFYKGGLDKQAFAFKPRIIINSGTFYTYSPTPFFFLREASRVSHLRLGHIAYCMAANIYLNSTDHALFKTDKRQWTFDPAKRYMIVINNECKESADKPCKHDVKSNDKTERNDFFNYTNTVHLQFREELELKLDRFSTQPTHGDKDIEALNLIDITSTQDAPCGALGYGQSGSLK